MGNIISLFEVPTSYSYLIYYTSLILFIDALCVIPFIKLRIEKLKNRLETELNSIFYICKKGCCRLDFDEAFMNNYKCLECSKILIPEENKKTVNNLSMELKQTIC